MDWKRCISALAIGAVSLAAAAQPLGPEQKRFHAIYQEQVETTATHSAGDTTVAAQRMARHLREAGFAEADVQILEPFPRKGNLVARFRGDGSKKPLLLLAHLDVVEALRADWKTDPFVLQESDGFFTARGSIDDKAMASAFVSVLSQLKRERSEEHTSELQSHHDLVCRLLLEKKKRKKTIIHISTKKKRSSTNIIGNPCEISLI